MQSSNCSWPTDIYSQPGSYEIVRVQRSSYLWKVAESITHGRSPTKSCDTIFDKWQYFNNSWEVHQLQNLANVSIHFDLGLTTGIHLAFSSFIATISSHRPWSRASRALMDMPKENSATSVSVCIAFRQENKHILQTMSASSARQAQERSRTWRCFRMMPHHRPTWRSIKSSRRTIRDRVYRRPIRRRRFECSVGSLCIC